MYLFCTVGALILHAMVSGPPPPDPNAALDNLLRHARSARAPELPPRLAGLDAPMEIRELEKEPPPHPPRNPASWAPYRGSLGLDRAAHLLNRTVIGPRFEEIGLIQEVGLAAALDTLCAPRPLPPPPGTWVDEPFPDTEGLTPAQIDSLVDLTLDRQMVLRMWWTERIASGPLSLTETMTLFWHDHFATGMEKVFLPQSMYRQNDLFRRHALGNFKALTREIAVDPAMLEWLDGRQNRVGSPNENFARELFELFTMGEGSGYTQTDVEEAARACTGWVTDGIDSWLVPWRFDAGAKTILGQTGAWDMDDLVDIIFEQPATAEYLCRKLCRWFLVADPAEADVKALAQMLRDADYEIEPVVRTLLGSAQFMDLDVRGAIIRDGADIYAGQVRRFHVDGFAPSAGLVEAQENWVYWQMILYEHMLLDPPNVAGWPGQRTWINTTTLPWRKLMSTMLVDGMLWETPLEMQIDVMAEAQRFSDPDDAGKLVDDLALLCFGMPPTPLVRGRMLEELLQGAEPYDWSLSRPGAEDRLRDLLSFTMRLPDYQLK